MEVGDPSPKTQTEKSTDPIWAHLIIRETLNLRAQKDLRTEISVGCASQFDFLYIFTKRLSAAHTRTAPHPAGLERYSTIIIGQCKQ